jgi:hypothetical protein
MDEPDARHSCDTEPDPDRRTVLTGLMAAYVVSSVQSTVAQAVDAAPRDAFMAVSRTLTGRSTLEPDQAARLYEALVVEVPTFAADVQALRTFIDERKSDPAQLQQALDAEQSPLAEVPRKIVKAWYTGIVGEAERARCITFETSLMYVAVADHLNPPSYCYGGYGSWMEKPA